MSDSDVKAVLPEPNALTDLESVSVEGTGEENANVLTFVPNSEVELAQIKGSTVRTHTITIDSSSSTSTDVGVQATPAAVSADLQTPQKQQRGILAVTSDMRNSAMNRKNQKDNHPSVTNTKEKTPMCLINELARFNKLAHKYVLVDEKGPAHKKEFHIRLDLGTENYHAVGTSIKRAQHAAAEVALGITNLQRPTCKPIRVETPLSNDEKKKPAVTPTVELNALAMKLGEHAEYINVDTHGMLHMHPRYVYPRVADYHHHSARLPHYLYHNMFLPPHMRSRMPTPFSVLLRIGRHEFKGQGATRQHARHNAANKALKVLNNSPFQRRAATPEPEESQPQNETNCATPSQESEDQPPLADADATKAQVSSDETHMANKSEISQVHEMALHYGKELIFEVIHESGPPHMRNFITRAVCGDLTSEGEGNSKKKSKKKAAESMLAKLEALNQPTPISKQKVKNIANKKKNRNLIKMHKANIEYGCGINPISRLIQIQQANKRKEPIYTLVMEHGLPRRREFIIQVECNDKACQGKGPNKKLAKRNAAEEMLQVMGYSKPSPTPGKSALKSPDYSTGSPTHQSKHVTFLDSTQTNKLPGVLVITDNSSKSTSSDMSPFKADLAASLAKELLEKGKSAVGETLLPAKEHPKLPLQRYREKLEYLGSCMGFAVEFTDFPKGSGSNMCLTVVTLQTSPAQVFHGSAATVDQSHDKAALQALKKLAQSGEDESIEEKTALPTVIKEGSDDRTQEENGTDGDSVVETACNGEEQIVKPITETNEQMMLTKQVNVEAVEDQASQIATLDEVH